MTDNKANTVIFIDQNPSFWKSCNIINGAYLEVIKELSQKKTDIHTFMVLKDKICTKEEESKFQNILNNKKITKLFILSHIIEPDLILTRYENALKKNLSNLHIYYTVMGDLTIEVERWKRLDLFLKKRHIKIIVASSAYQRLCKEFIKGIDICTIPFPVQNLFFESIEKEINHETIVLSYAGRLSLDKGIKEIFYMAELIKLLNLNIQINIAGEVFNRTNHFFGHLLKKSSLNKYVTDNLKKYAGIVTYHGNLEQCQLRKLFSETDYFFSMSLYHDEDFGVSVAQAIAQGCGVFITSWAGYKSFNPPFGNIKVPVTQSENFLPCVSKGVLKSRLLELSKIKSMQRRENQLYAKNLYSPLSIAKKLLSTGDKIPKEYEGLTDHFYKYESCFSKTMSPYIEIKKSKEIQSLYKTTYNSFY